MKNHLQSKGVVFSVIVVLVLIVYGQTYDYPFVLDDDLYIQANKTVQEHDVLNAFTKSSTYGYDGLNEGAYRPILVVSFMLDHLMFGNDASGYHLMQLVYFTLLCLFIYLFIYFRAIQPI